MILLAYPAFQSMAGISKYSLFASAIQRRAIHLAVTLKHISVEQLTMGLQLIMQYLFLGAVLGILGSFPILLFAAVRKQPLPIITRGLLVFLLLAPVPFLLFGFLASFEPGTHWGWRLGYGVFLLWSTITAARLCWVKPGPSADTHSPRAEQATDKALDIKQDIDPTDSEIKRE